MIKVEDAMRVAIESGIMQELGESEEGDKDGEVSIQRRVIMGTMVANVTGVF